MHRGCILKIRAKAIARLNRAALVETLEKRRLLSAVYPTPYEQYVIELYNQARGDPAGTAAKYGVGLNDGQPAGVITSDPKQPVAINPYLTDSSRSYAQWVIDTNAPLDHVGADGSNAATRMSQAGYIFRDPGASGENAGIDILPFIPDYVSIIDSQFQDFYIDGAVAGRYHRLTMMNPVYKEAGAGVVLGFYQGLVGFVTAEDFALSGTGSFLTGVAYTDSNHNNFYTPGEQMGGATITAIRASDGARFTTTTWSSGGYSLSLPQGTYTVWGNGGSLNGYVRYDNVVIGNENVKKDFRPDYVGNDPGPDPFASLVGGQLTINGMAIDDAITVTASDQIYVVLNGVTESFTPSLVQRIVVLAGSGNDIVTIGVGLPFASIYGGAGDDVITVNGNTPTTIYGEAGNDSISGGNNEDYIDGGDGNDTIAGYDGNDTLIGGIGDDFMSGGDGNDQISGGAGNDRLYGGNGYDTINGDAGDDTLFGQGDNDVLDGGSGADYISGGLGNDAVNYSSRTAGLYIDLGTRLQSGNDGEANEHDNVLDDVETIWGGSGNDMLIGSSSANRILGGSGNDTILGGGGNDWLYGQNGNDSLDGGAGADYLSGGTGNDTADYSSRTANLVITLGNSSQPANDGELNENDQVLDDIETVFGGSGNDSITASSAVTTSCYFVGNDGNDSIKGGLGHDILLGGNGNDFIDAAEGVFDLIDGGVGTDMVRCDIFDAIVNVELPQFVVV